MKDQIIVILSDESTINSPDDSTDQAVFLSTFVMNTTCSFITFL